MKMQLSIHSSIFIFTLAFSQLHTLKAALEITSFQQDARKLDAPCVKIFTWSEFEQLINHAIIYKNSTEPINFCPFFIEKTSTEPLLVNGTLNAVCAQENECIIDATSSGTDILKIKGSEANAYLRGFVFQGSGKYLSAVHVTFGTSMKQIFHKCKFVGNVGKSRGTAIRAESLTQVDIIQSTFQDNGSSDIGTIFNRGKMLIQGSTFEGNHGTGGAVGSSKFSITTLKNNKFIGNYDGVPIFFHVGTDFQDMSGNKSWNNDACNGIYVFKGDLCNPFDQDGAPTTSAPSVAVTTQSSKPSSHVTAQKQPNSASCEIISVSGQPCITVNNFQTLRDIIVQSTSGTLIFCPFTVEKDADASILIDHELNIACQQSKKCRIIGPNNHVFVKGVVAQIHLQGFVFEDATISALHILSDTPRRQTICSCEFIGNQGGNRGIGIRTEPGTNVEILSARFVNNKSDDIGGAIFNRGSMLLGESEFVDNSGIGGAVGSGPKSKTIFRNNYFIRNIEGPGIYFHNGDEFEDIGGNMALDNSNCNGVFFRNNCVEFSETRSPTASSVPTPPPINTVSYPNAPRGGPGYFNYDPFDSKYGPGVKKQLNAGSSFTYDGNNWGSVLGNPEHERYIELYPTHQRDLRNKCGYNFKQSPIDLCENKINTECFEHHQTRTHSGNVTFGEQVEPQILPSKLRLKYYKDRTPDGGPYPPEADFANNWHGYMEVNHIDIKIPSEHTICGERYPAEYSIVMLHPKRREVITMSILLAFDPDDLDNAHLQKAIDEWQKVYDANEDRCNEYEETGKARKLIKDETPFGTGGWDPFHESLERSIYFWGYWGSLTEPPCSTFIAWRVLTEPAYISQKQFKQLKKILFTNRNEKCEYTTVQYQSSVARPIQDFAGRELYKCKKSDYLSDKEKKPKHQDDDY